MDSSDFNDSRFGTEMTKFYKSALIIIILGSAFVRLIGLDINPPHLGNDEISIAFDSYSIRLTGRDEHGKLWPISFQSHRSYKAPLYAYFNIPFNFLFGNTEYGIRTLSAVAGCISVYLTARIGYMIGGPAVGIISAILMATNPKNIFASRIGYESNLATSVLLLGIFGLLKFVDNRKIIWSLVGGFFLGLSIWGYHTEWGLVPLILVISPMVFRKTLPIKKWLWIVLTTILVSLPIYYNFITVQINDPNNRASSQLWFSEGQFRDYLYNSRDNKFKKAVKIITTPVYSYLEHFGLNINFTSGSDLFNQKSPLNVGWFLLATVPMLFWGIKNGVSIFGKWWNFLIVWWLISPIIPAMSGSVSSVRNLPFVVPSCLIMAGGFVCMWNKYVKFRYLIVLIFILNLVMFCIAYFVHYRFDSGNNFQYGYKQAWEIIKPNISKYKRIIVEDRFGEFGQFVGVPHLYFGYFGAFSVEEMQKRHDDNGLTIGKYTFKYVDWNKETFTPNTVYIVTAINKKTRETSDKLKEVDVVRNVDFKPQFLIYETTVK